MYSAFYCRVYIVQLTLNKPLIVDTIVRILWNTNSACYVCMYYTKQ